MKSEFKAAMGLRAAKSLIMMMLVLSGITSGNAQTTKTTQRLTGEAADRLAIQQLIDGYAHDADRIGGHWFFAKRQLIFDWTDKRPSNP